MSATAIAEYSITESALAKLKAKLQGAKYDVATTAGMDTAKKDRRELVTLRTDLEKKRVEIKAPALERCRLIDAEAKRITAELLLLEQPIDAQIKVEEDRKAAIKAEKERIEQERIAAIRGRIDRIRALPLTAPRNSEGLELFIAKVEAAQIGEEFQELAEEAETVKAEIVAALKEALNAALEQEAEEKRRQLEREKEERRLAEDRQKFEAEKAEQDRLRKIEEDKLAEKQAELAKLCEAEAARQKEADDKARAEREESDRIAAEERGRQQAIIDAEREKLRQAQEVANRRDQEANERLAAEEAERQSEIIRREEAANTTITILKSEYDHLLSEVALLDALRAGGVDNWDGWDFALESLEVAQ